MNTKGTLDRTGDAQRGFGLIEIMVGVVIGLIAVLVIYQVYTVAEGFKRNTTAAGEAQMNGLFSSFVLGLEIGNGGAAIAVSAPDLASCADPTTFPASDPRHFAESFRPIPVMIYDGGGASTPDSFVVNYSIATTMAKPVLFNANAAANALTYDIQSPGGFHKGDLIVGIANPAGTNSQCGSSKVTADPGVITVPPTCDPNDPVKSVNCLANVTITHTGTNISFTGTGLTGSSTLFNLGPADRAQKIRYSVNNGVLYSTPLLDSNGAPAVLPGNPLASNIVNMKVEYGIDSIPDLKGLLDTWVQASAAGWDPASLLPATVPKINQIKAIRIGIIVQSEQFDKNLADFTGGDYLNGNYNWVLFDCADLVKANCPGRLTGTVLQTVSPKGNWRFRKYETVIPLRNEIWNKS
jgi:type IV pilus assembly protein PilW